MKKNAKSLATILYMPVANDDFRPVAAAPAVETAAPASVPVAEARKVEEKAASRKPRRVRRGFMVDVRAAATSSRRLELLIGVIFAGFVPLAVFETAHVAIPQVLANEAAYGSYTQLFAAALVAVVLGGLGYSAPTVYAVGLEAFGSKKVKAAGFTLLVEGVMTMVPIHWLQVTALILLIAINAVGTACSLARSVKTVDSDDVDDADVAF